MGEAAVPVTPGSPVGAMPSAGARAQLPLHPPDRRSERRLLAPLTSEPAVLERGRQAGNALEAYLQELLAERRAALGDDILANLIRAEEQGDRLSPSELVSQPIGLLIAGFETTIGLIENGVLALLRHPDQLARLRATPSLLPSAVEECLRFNGPIPLTLRILHADHECGGSRIPRDPPVLAMLGAANRDPEAFPEPDRFETGRAPNRHPAFRGGARHCLSAHLARMEAQVAIGTLLRHTRHVEFRDDERPMSESLFRVRAHLPLAIRG